MLHKEELLDIAINAARESLDYLQNKRSIEFCLVSSEINNELKSEIDFQLDALIKKCLIQTNIFILSEESAGDKSIDDMPDLKWVIDPLDGTVNYVRNIGPCGISLALCFGAKPLFGVIAEFPHGNIYWGGEGIGSFENGRSIHVSSIGLSEEGVACTGKPSRLRIDDAQMISFEKIFSKFSKVRMLGSASISLVKLARGDLELYSENEIMLWDVAAGIAITEGAGGIVKVERGIHPCSLNVLATNGRVSLN